MVKDYGDFEEVNDNDQPQTGEGEVFARARLPRNGELIGVLLQRLGGNRMEIKASDGKIRNCRVPGRFKRSLWLRPGDFVLITPWPDDNDKGDVIFKYNSSQIIQLRKKGLLTNLSTDF